MTVAGWNKEKVSGFKEAFYDFLKYIKIDSKETGGAVTLQLYEAQRRFLDGIFDGLERNIHHFVILKARQLGISTISYILTIFYCSLFSGLKGAIVFHDETSRDALRELIKRAIDSLPSSHKIILTRNSRNGLTFENGSTVSFLVAGTRKSKGSGGLGRSQGLNFLHATEMSSYGDLEGVRSLEKTLAQRFPDRLFIWESTARGFNLFYDLWEEAKADDLKKKAIFIGWWAKEDYSYAEGTPEFERYGTQPATEEEQEKIEKVRELYGHEVTMGQLAWYRHNTDPRGDNDNDEISDVELGIQQQELPWTEDEAFVMTGSAFFPAMQLTKAASEAKPKKFKAYRYYMSDDFLSTMVEQVFSAREAQLKVWEEPDPNGVYVIGADPAFGASDSADRYCAQVLRCYADGLDQVAEFCTPVMMTYQFAWVVAHLCGAYSNARLLLEINGPGEAVWNEFRHLRDNITNGYMRDDAEKMGLRNIFSNVRNYIFKRADSIIENSSAWHWKTTAQNKEQIFHYFRDIFCQGQLRINSIECLDEMRHVIQEGPVIAAEGSKKDDRPMAMALALRAWHDGERKALMAQNRTRENEAKRPHLTQEDLSRMFSESIVGSFFAQQQSARLREQRLIRRRAWRGR